MRVIQDLFADGIYKTEQHNSLKLGVPPRFILNNLTRNILNGNFVRIIIGNTLKSFQN